MIGAFFLLVCFLITAYLHGEPTSPDGKKLIIHRRLTFILGVILGGLFFSRVWSLYAIMNAGGSLW